MKKVNRGGLGDAANKVSKRVHHQDMGEVQTSRRIRESSGESLKRLNIELPEDVHKELKLEAVMKGVSMRQLVEEMLRARYR
ncbi:MAG: toxin-antitoxin system HicB family antitoxin [Mariprofundaceae bacterium]|nr:toxin-antitoxin system HicB family antitoxin [Mariprofundaceae bacterium]